MIGYMVKPPSNLYFAFKRLQEKETPNDVMYAYSVLLVAVHLCLNTFNHVQRHFTACHRNRILGGGRGISGWILLSQVVWSQAEKVFACNLTNV